MLLFLLVVLVGMALWYLIFIMFGGFWRNDGPHAPSAMPVPPPAANRTNAVDAVPLGWTALDDQQLTRLLKGAAP